MSRYNNYNDFKEYELYPTLFECIDRAFPSMHFRRYGANWVSTHHLTGEEDSQKQNITFIYGNRKYLAIDHSRNYLNLIDLYINLNGVDYPTALESLAKICNLELPNTDKEEYIAYKERQENREKANNLFKAALWSGSDEANKILRYLREVRLWSDEEIKKAELGYVDNDLLAQLPDRTEYTFTKEGRSIGGSHRLTIPFWNGSRLFGFKFRDINAAGEDKYKYLNNKGLSKSSGLFGIGVGVKDVTIVEGELDALHAKVKGADNVVATTGNGASSSQIEEAMKRGVKRFTLLFDNDERGQGFIASTIATIEKQGGEVYVAALPDQYKDTDEYLASHSIEEWRTIVDDLCETASEWKYRRISSRYEGDLTAKQRGAFFDEAEALLNSAKPRNREEIYSLMKEDEKRLNFKVDDIRDYIDKAYLRKQEKERATAVREATSTLHALIEGGRIDEALDLMRETASTQSQTEKASEFAKIFASSSPEGYSKLLSETKEGIPTGIVFKQGYDKEELTLNAGLTFICGYRGHGKTSFLNNIALNEAKRNRALGNGKSVLYFSYEIDKKRLIADLLNTFVNDRDISRSPSQTILSYFRGKNTFTQGGKLRRSDGSTTYENFIRQKDIFFRDYLSSGSLVIVEENYKVEKLLEAIKYYLSQKEASLICLDYAQLIYSEEYSRLRTEEIKRVVNDIKDFANRVGIPFVLAAQFNREVNSPVSVDTKNIGEGGDFERIADTCLGLFNLKELHSLAGSGSADETKEAIKLLNALGRDLPDLDEKLSKELSNLSELRPVRGAIFVRLLKRRYGYYPLDTILEWEGRTKYIKPNDEKQLSVEATEGSLFEDGSAEAHF